MSKQDQELSRVPELAMDDPKRPPEGLSSEATTEWLRSGEYLPEFMRDFHDQKDLFKALQDVVERRNAKPGSYTKDLSWIAAHVYSVDVLLWVLARHGWTLQRSRKRVPFGDVADFIGEAKTARDKQMSSVLRSAFGSRKKEAQP